MEVSVDICIFDINASNDLLNVFAMYHDTYPGGDKFVGEEALWIEQKPFWSMNYAGC